MSFVDTRSGKGEGIYFMHLVFNRFECGNAVLLSFMSILLDFSAISVGVPLAGASLYFAPLWIYLEHKSSKLSKQTNSNKKLTRKQ